jgi:threonine dehydratase
MPDISPQVKVNATKGYGAEVVFCTADISSRAATTNKLIEEFGYTMIHPFDNDDVIEGQGTAALELLQDYPDLDYIFCPVGGGGLLSGTLICSKGFNSNIKVYAVEPELVDDAYRSFKEGKILTNQTTNSIADGLRTNLSERTFSYIQKYLDDIITVSEKEIINAMHFLWERMKIVVEPSGAVSLAGILSKKIEVRGKKIGAILSGGNVDLKAIFEQYKHLLE